MKAFHERMLLPKMFFVFVHLFILFYEQLYGKIFNQRNRQDESG